MIQPRNIGSGKHNLISPREKYIHDLIMQSSEIQIDILNNLGLSDLTKLELIHEDRYINGIIADFTLIYDNKIKAIIECKAGDIGVTDYVRGIGQLLQYEYFFEKQIEKGTPYDENFHSILFFPSSIVKNNLFNLGRFKYPKTTLLFELNESSNITRRISDSELNILGNGITQNLITISQYYVRDNRLFEIYLLLKILMIIALSGKANKINRKGLEISTLHKLQTPNNKNWRNAFITLSSLGLIDHLNLPSPAGLRIGTQNYEEFLITLYKSYLKPYFDLLLDYFSETPDNLTKTNTQIANNIREKHNGQDILFLTESNGRYLSSWLNILRDDYGCIDFAPRSQDRKLIYKLSDYNDKRLQELISKNTKGKQYLNHIQDII